VPSPDWSASEAAARGPKIPFRGRVWRAHWREVDPTDWKLSLGSSGRYHQGRDMFSADQCWAALYTSLTPEVAVWEMVRRSAARNLDYLRNNVLTELDIDVKVVLDATEPASIGPQIADLTGTDPSACRQLALAAIREGCEGLLVPFGCNARNESRPVPKQFAKPTAGDRGQHPRAADRADQRHPAFSLRGLRPQPH